MDFAGLTVPPALTPAEGDRLASLLPDHAARQALVEGHVKFCIQVATSYIKRYKLWKMPITDLVNEGCIGVMAACDKYDKSRGTTFTTYAFYCIRSHVVNAILRNRGIISIPANVTLKHPHPLTADELLKLHNWDKLPHEEYGCENLTTLPDRDAFTAVDAKLDVPVLTDGLPDRLQLVLKERYLAVRTLEDIGRQWHITRERVRQLEAKALQLIRAKHEIKS